jgi:hypothetical protein
VNPCFVLCSTLSIHAGMVKFIGHGGIVFTPLYTNSFCLSDRGGEALLCACGVLVTHEALRQWSRKCGHP